MKKLAAKARVSGKILKSEPLRMHFQHSGAKIRVFEQNTDILNFGFLGGNFQRKVDGEFTCFSRPPALIEIPRDVSKME